MEKSIPRLQSLLSALFVKGEVNLNIKLHLNDSFYTLINKYHPHMTKFCMVLKIYLGGVTLYFC